MSDEYDPQSGDDGIESIQSICGGPPPRFWCRDLSYLFFSDIDPVQVALVEEIVELSRRRSLWVAEPGSNVVRVNFEGK